MSKRSEKSKKGRKVVRIVASEEEVTEDDKKVLARLFLGRVSFNAMVKKLWEEISAGKDDEVLLMRMARDVSGVCEDAWNIGMLSQSEAQIVARVSAEYKPDEAWYSLLVKLAKRTMDDYSRVGVIVRNATSYLNTKDELEVNFEVRLCEKLCDEE